MFLLHKLLVPLVLTIGIELPVSFIRNRSSTLFLGVIAVNMATNPLLNFIIYILNYFMTTTQTGLIVVALEVTVIFIEWRLLSYITRDKSASLFFYSLVMNLASYLFGVIFF